MPDVDASTTLHPLVQRLQSVTVGDLYQSEQPGDVFAFLGCRIHWTRDALIANRGHAVHFIVEDTNGVFHALRVDTAAVGASESLWQAAPQSRLLLFAESIEGSTTTSADSLVELVLALGAQDHPAPVVLHRLGDGWTKGWLLNAALGLLAATERASCEVLLALSDPTLLTDLTRLHNWDANRATTTYTELEEAWNTAALSLWPTILTNGDRDAIMMLDPDDTQDLLTVPHPDWAATARARLLDGASTDNHRYRRRLLSWIREDESVSSEEPDLNFFATLQTSTVT